jgi:hypothetical protein
MAAERAQSAYLEQEGADWRDDADTAGALGDIVDGLKALPYTEGDPESDPGYVEDPEEFENAPGPTESGLDGFFGEEGDYQGFNQHARNSRYRNQARQDLYNDRTDQGRRPASGGGGWR